MKQPLVHMQACSTRATSDLWKTAELEIDRTTILAPLRLAREGSYCSGLTDFEQEGSEREKKQLPKRLKRPPQKPRHTPYMVHEKLGLSRTLQKRKPRPIKHGRQ